MSKLTHFPAWQALTQHYQHIVNQSMQDWFAADNNRFRDFSLSEGDILFDYSKNRITRDTRTLLCKLADEAHLADKITALFAGQPINFTEARPALHTALRNPQQAELQINQHNIMPDIRATLAKMQTLVTQIHAQQYFGVTRKPIRDIVNIGIGGSHLGPMMTTHALRDAAVSDVRCFFISNLDGAEIEQVLQKIDPERTLFIISSKSFTTLETLTNAKLVKKWLQDKLGETNVKPHFAAVTAAKTLAENFGIDETMIFPIWDWVGGRYSIWSAIGLPLALQIGMKNFYDFLAGAHAIDQHVTHTDFDKNIPVLMGLLGIWYINFFGATEHAIVPYAHSLQYLRAYIQQADMESNGKRITHDDELVDYMTGPIIFGEQGCDSQHSFFQLLHQSPRFVPVDFILAAQTTHFAELQNSLVASGLSQAEALMKGVHYDTAPHKTLPGNRPSNTLLIKCITPYTLGALIALYEHKIFVQGAIWNINSFDQWGVELGKKLLPDILSELNQTTAAKDHDASTLGLMAHYKKMSMTK